MIINRYIEIISRQIIFLTVPNSRDNKSIYRLSKSQYRDNKLAKLNKLVYSS